MKSKLIHVLVSFDKNYIGPFQTMLKSLVVNNVSARFHIWLLHSAIPDDGLCMLAEYCARQGVEFTPVQISRDLFESAPVSK